MQVKGKTVFPRIKQEDKNMKGKIKRTLAVLLVMALIVSALSLNVFATDSENGVVETGFCGAQGENLTWTFYENGELVISGEGEMANYKFVTGQPWNKYRTEIKVITVEEGVTSLGCSAFSMNGSCYYKVYLPESLEYVGEYSVYNRVCGQILAIIYAGSEEEWKLVKERKYNPSIPYEDESWFEKAYIGYETDIDLTEQNAIYSTEMYYNGEEPQAHANINSFTELKGQPGNRIDLFAHYYISSAEDCELVWYGKYQSDDEWILLQKNSVTSNNNELEVTVPPKDFGNLTVFCQVIDSQGYVIAKSNEVEIINEKNNVNVTDDRSFGEKVELFFKGILGYSGMLTMATIFLSSAFVAAIISLPQYIYQKIVDLFN